MRRAVILVFLALSACMSAPAYRRPPVQQPVRGTDAAALRQCVAKMDRIVARYALLPDRTFAGQCSALGAVQLRDIGTPVTNLGAMTCGLGYAFTLWVQSDLQVPAMGEFGSSSAAGLTVSLEPMTTATSVFGKSSLISSISITMS